jgi:hypothetical protein
MSCWRNSGRTGSRAAPGNRLSPGVRRAGKGKGPTAMVGPLFVGCLTVTYFRMGSPHYHRRAAVSRSCSGWEGVGPAGYGRQALTEGRRRRTEDRRASGCRRLLPRREEVRGLGSANTVRRTGREGGQGEDVALSVFCPLSSVFCGAHGYGVKPHGPLVSVSLTRYRASTPDLSTWWSATTLQGARGPGRSHLQARFPLRCFQRLSLPYIATRHCDWRHNRYTSGTSTPVLSY